MSGGTDNTARPFDGVRVIDLSRVMSGPFCTAMLADLGAEVIKIEALGSGDESRHFGPFVGTESAYFWMLNRGKRSITLNLKSPRGVEILKELAATADVVIENFRPGVAARLGVDADTLRAENPRLIYASISGFGQEGPLADRPAFDLVVQAMSGLMDITGQRDGPPTAVGESLADVCAGMFSAWGIAAALFAREKSGEGRTLDISMLDSMVSMMVTMLSLHLYTDNSPKRVGSRHPVTYPVDAFRTADGYIVMVVPSDGAFHALCKAMGQDALADDPRFGDNAGRSAHETELKALIETWTETRSTEDAIAALDEARIPAGPVNSVAEVVGSAHTAFRNLIQTVPHPQFGDVQVAPQPVRFSDADRTVLRPPPALGADTRDVLSDVLGLDDAALDALVADNVIQE